MTVWRGAAWLASRMAAAGFEVPRIASEVFVSEAVALGFLSSREPYDRFWSESADELVVNGFDYDRRAPGRRRSAYVDAVIADRTGGDLALSNPGLFGWQHLRRGGDERVEASFARFRSVVAERKAEEVGREGYARLADRLDKGPAAAFKVLAEDLPLRFVKGRELSQTIDGPCLISVCEAPLKPFLYFEPGRHWRALHDLSVSVGVYVPGGAVRFFNVNTLLQQMHWYRRVEGMDEAALGLAAHARFVVELAAAMNEGEASTGETTR